MILFTDKEKACTPLEVQNKITSFNNGYAKAIEEIIRYSTSLDENGEVFVFCAARILISFKMTWQGPFKGIEITKNNKVLRNEVLKDIWEEIGEDLKNIHDSIINSSLSRDRYLLELDQISLNALTADIWRIFKKILPFSMGEYTFGLVAASKILFSILPEIVLPVDTKQWRTVFKTVDIGDIIKDMKSEIQKWETITGAKFNKLDNLKRLTTLPSVYNVMAMGAR